MYISQAAIPLIIFIIICFGLSKKENIYREFIDGAKSGLKTVASIAPTLIGLMVAVGILRSSGFLDFISQILSGVFSKLGFPPELVPLSIVRLFSSSAATGLVIDIFKQFGPDSYIGTVASIMASCTETVFYTMSIYFLEAKVTKTRWTLAGALLSTLAGIIASVILTNIFF